VGSSISEVVSASKDYHRWRWTSRDELLYSDLAIYGVIVDLTTERVSINEYTPNTWKGDEATFPITNLKLRVIEVLSGSWDEDVLWAVAPGGFPGDPPHAGLGFSYDYSIGDTTVICFMYNRSLKGGSYTVRTDKGRFVFRNGLGICQHAGSRNLTLGQIRETVEAGQLKSVIEEADVIGIGTVTQIREPVDRTDSGMDKQIEHVEVKVSSLIKGEIKDDVVTFKMIRKGFYDPPWRENVPNIKRKQKLFFFLKKGNVGFYPFAGSNGLFRVDGEALLYNDRMKYGMKVVELERKVRAELEGEE
jgi:hypothetical protein